MRWTFIPYIEDSTANPTFKRLLEKDERLASLVTGFPHFSELKKLADKRAMQASHRAILVDELLRQNSRTASESSLANIEALRSQSTFSVTTGHQLNIFSGPAFFIYKIAHTISLANELTAKLENNQVVPIYWMASEDHDLEEINHFYAYKEKLLWDEPYAGAVGRMPVAKLNSVLQQWKEVMRWEDENPRYQLFSSYVKQDNLAEATRFLVNELFGKHGIVVLDADSKELKSLFVPNMVQEITERAGQKELSTLENYLEEVYLKTQIHARDINLFYLTEQDRLRLTHEGDEVVTVGGAHRWTKDELLVQLAEHPDRFSPNVVLRPVYQEVILPNLAYIGGPGELSYWLQLKPLFDRMNVSYPVLMPRNGATILAAHQVKKLNKLNIDVQALKGREEDVISKWVEENKQVEVSLNEQKSELASLFKKVQSQLETVDKSLAKKGEGALVRSQKELEGLEKAMERAVKSKNDVAINQLIALKNNLFPEGSPQERHQTYFALEAAIGGAIIDELVANFPPFNSGMNIISPEF
ncbi:MAG: bacillithiol biosynthesis cysteine-adding enzyme BshC [Flavobacteriales bacterium]|nr:bacillithiol biosynthesis cysteine-adding enzyme BshC [Flavobacteriales bacterium]MDG1781326.1 bacillithiol biosynthesis cysteine-adding enzyme BshC [Flavobacteriales bacterium]MDG2245923.1 bacillithiol biosynthesis cysteine-adding enzyme BshC [Flavobacteriales bacterium]